MALPEASEQSDKKPADPAPRGPQDKNKLHSKVIVRRLPPNMDKETFLNQVSPVPHYDYMYMVKGDASLGENAFARAYINFTHHNDIYDFKEKFDNYVFLDAAGHEYPAVVEFAAFQKIPKRRNKVRVDPKVASIETDPYYLEFVEMLNKPPEKDDQKPEYSYQITTENKNDTMTPLLEYIKNKRAERLRIREERREERKRKEFERKKYREDERKKRFDSPVKGKGAKPKDKEQGEDGDKAAGEEQAKKPEGDEAAAEKPYYKTRKFEDRKKDVKSKYPQQRKEYVDKREFKNSRREEYKEREYGNRSKYDDYKKDAGTQKKVKKYSEKREERKMEAQKAELKKQQQQDKESKDSGGGDGPKNAEDVPKESPKEKKEKPKHEESKAAEAEAKPVEKKESQSFEKKESQSSRRIRNKDRPTIAIYRPGMLSKRKQSDGGEGESSKKE